MEVLTFQTIRDARGSLSVIERLPFDIKRVYYLHGITGPRGGHAHRRLERVMFAPAGSVGARFTFLDGYTEVVMLTGPERGVYVPPMTWVELDGFSAGAVCMVLASEEYDPADYIRDPVEFR